MPDNLRHAQYGQDSIQVDDPQTVQFPVRFNPVIGSFVYPGGTLVAATPLRSLLAVGDSITSYFEATVTVTSITNLGNGTARVNTAGHSMCVGQKIRTAAAPDPTVNRLSASIISITDANNFIISLDGQQHTVTGNSPVMARQDRLSTRGWLNWLETLAKQPFAKTIAAVPGATISQMRSVVSNLPVGQEDFATICAGMNDIYSAGNSLATLQADFAGLLQAVKARTSNICIISVPCRDSADGAWDTTKQDIHTAFNRWLYDLAAYFGYDFVDSWAAVQGGVTYVNAANTNPDPNTSMAFDTTHPSMRGAYAIADAVLNVCSKKLGVRGWKAPHAAAINSAVGNLLTGSNFATNTAGVATGWLRDSVTANTSAVFTTEARTVVADGDSSGFNQVITANYGTSTGTAEFRFRKNGIHTVLTAGNSYQMYVPFTVTGALGLIGLELACFGTVGSTFDLIFGHNQDSNTDAMVGSFSGVLMTPVFVCPAGLTNMDTWVRGYLTSAQNTDVIVKLYQPLLKRIT